MKFSSKNKLQKNTQNITKPEEKKPNFWDVHSQLLGIVGTCLAFLMSLIMFNPDVSVGGDDSTYLEAAYKFANDIAFPTWQGPIYPMLLGYIINLFGYHILFFKFLSVIFFTASVWFTYKIFAHFGNNFSAVVTSLLSAISLMLLNYSSSTYTEPLFMMLQSGFLYYLIEVLNREKSWCELPDSKAVWKKYIIHFSILALIGYVMFQTRSLAIVVVPLLILLLIVMKKFRPAIIVGVASSIFHAVNALYRKIFWNVESVSFTKQLDSILLVNPYNENMGYENFGGFCKRFVDNSEQYLSKHFVKFCGFMDYDSRLISGFATILIGIILVLVGIYLWRRNKNLFIVFGYVIILEVVTFVMLQKLWDQERLIMIYFPLMLGMIFYAISEIFSKKLKFLPLLASGILLLTIGKQTIKSGNFDVSDNFDSGSYNTYSDDWRNYMLASKWASDSLPQGSVVVCRKSQMSWVASEGNENVKFQGLYKLYSRDADSMRNFLFDTLKGTHVIMANLRLNPYEKNGKTINTVRMSLKMLLQKYGNSLRLLKQFGDDEPAYLFSFCKDGTIDAQTLTSRLIVENNTIVPWRNLVMYYINIRDLNSAQKVVNNARALGYDDPQFNADLNFLEGFLKFNMGDFAGMIEMFDRVLKFDSNNADAYFNKAVGLFNLERYSEALLAVQQAKAHGCQNPGVEQMETTIKQMKRL